MSGEPLPRETRGETTRNRLVEAVIGSVAKHGLEGTSITRLVEMTGLSRGLVSFHFAGKDQLLAAALEHAISVYEASWETSVLAPDKNAAERLHTVVDHDTDFALREPGILALWWAAWGERRAKSVYREQSLSRDECFIRDIAAMFRDAGLEAARARISALTLNSFLLGLWLHHHLGERDADLAQLRKAGHRLVEGMLGERGS